MAWYPKAIRKEVARHRTRRNHRGGRVCLHVAVSNSDSLFGYFNRSGSPTSHFYVRKSGVIEQYVDTQYCAPANLEGNDSLISFETEGGVTNANSEPWTAAQIQAMAECVAWLNKVHGVPLKLMPNSKSTSTGIGYHKQGVDPYRVDGGEKWSKAYGKICPGQGKINQIPTIINKAKVIAGGTLPSTPPPVQPTKEWDEMATKAEVEAAAYTAAYRANSDYAKAFWVASSGTGTAIRKQLSSIQAALDSLRASLVNIVWYEAQIADVSTEAAGDTAAAATLLTHAAPRAAEQAVAQLKPTLEALQKQVDELTGAVEALAGDVTEEPEVPKA